MHVAESDSGQALDEFGAENVVGHRDVHVAILDVVGVGAQQHHLVVLGEVVVGDGDRRGAADHVDEAVSGAGEVAVVDPDVLRREDGDRVAVRTAAVADVRGGRHDARGARGTDVVDGHPVDDDVRDELKREARAPGNVHVRAATVDGLERRDHELVLELDRHGVGEGDPERAGSSHGVAECSWRRVRGVVVAVGRHHVDAPILATDGVAAESHRAVG